MACLHCRTYTDRDASELPNPSLHPSRRGDSTPTPSPTTPHHSSMRPRLRCDTRGKDWAALRTKLSSCSFRIYLAALLQQVDQHTRSHYDVSQSQQRRFFTTSLSTTRTGLYAFYFPCIIPRLSVAASSTPIPSFRSGTLYHRPPATTPPTPHNRYYDTH